MFEAILLGIVQGLTEYLPVSSTAHLILVTKLTASGSVLDTLSFDVALHIGTLAAVVIYFYRDWIEMFTVNRRLLVSVIIATIPAGLAGYLLNDIVESYFRSPLIISISLIVVAVVMWIAEKCRKDKDIDALTLPDSLLIGCAQVLALVPGVSRSGITISAGMFRNLARDSAAKFSFLLSTPVIGGAALLHLVKIVRHGESLDPRILAAGILTSAVSGFLAIRFLMKFLKSSTLKPFVYYRIFLGIVIIIILLWTKG
jgi:undecaprenyl-diphosphatase